MKKFFQSKRSTKDYVIEIACEPVVQVYKADGEKLRY